ncbi:MAG: hypothetical protein C4520_09515 [Candidatus Abyssobacteria bacterium SURF_5]|uniref:Uncharacterized protein n=1 Tax=Abyssobacteria bacterium (strain SURF_5) TaxID=2093360 RepID=A0A3A4NUD3_ABYX5|nr:MAG: hypothetical protein C4520_09515 [Candidatus Abyssubacteria bacterium SURF_5]
MSIILRALKKIQNQERKQGSASASHAGAFVNESPSDMGLDLFREAQEAPPLQEAGAADRLRPTPAKPIEKIRSSNIPRVLLGLLLVLGLIATVWFASIIQASFRGGRAAGKETADQTKMVATAAKEEQTPVQPPVAAPPETRAAVPPVPGTAPEAASPPALAQEQLAEQPAAPPVPAPQPVESAAPAPQAEAAIPKEPAAPEYEAVIPTGKEAAAIARASTRPRKQQEAEFASAGEEEKERPEFKINAIAWRAREPKAIVNMQRVYVGDRIEGALVKEIRRKSILFEYDSEEFEVRF